jgi:hypothetical protein
MSFDFNHPQFTTQQLLSCCPELPHDTFKQWLKRRVLLLSMGPEIGSGRRPLYTGSDVVQVALRHQLAPWGVFATKFNVVWQLVQGRIISRRSRFASISPGPSAVFMHIDPVSGDLMAIAISESDNDQSDLAMDKDEVPDFHMLFRMDRFLDRMVQRMERVKSGLPAVEKHKADDVKNSASEWSFDEAGERIFVGLSKDESEEITALVDLIGRKAATEDQVRRFHELDDRHVIAKAVRTASAKPERDEVDFSKAWMTDDAGNRVRVGLSKEENDEFDLIQSRQIARQNKQSIFPWASVKEMNREKDRWLELHDKHEIARLTRLGEMDTS